MKTKTKAAAKRLWALKIVDDLGNTSYLTSYDGSITYMSGTRIPLSLSNLVLDDAAELHFSLEASRNDLEAITALNKVLLRRWANNLRARPRVNAI